MTHYQKLATMIFRIIGIIAIISSLIFWIPAFLLSPGINPLITLITVLPYQVVGIILFIFSKNLAKWVCFDFDRFND